MAETMRRTVNMMLQGIERYNPLNLQTFERYVEIQSQENAYHLEANLAVLKLYQINQNFNIEIICHILLKALTNLPHTDFILCKYLLNKSLCNTSPIKEIIELADLLECCEFQKFWIKARSMDELCSRIVGFHDSIRKFVCHVVGITFQTINKNLLVQLLGGVDDTTFQLKQWVQKYGWKEIDGNMIFIANQDENIKTKNITEKIDFETVSGIMAACN
ncbi:eukaryotic translation initiation factor 3 subunit K [Cimex lectularius]|uniref:Eukaryotic translation initiation factor 3 subunit K n=1 Tax=Cimex lectularius TaxID=79782 RepID=A0A8I6RPS5_CIMLE|nr:eukaryotic translation initiation factor 3 subunit K [Cimex lectularius]